MNCLGWQMIQPAIQFSRITACPLMCSIAPVKLKKGFLHMHLGWSQLIYKVNMNLNYIPNVDFQNGMEFKSLDFPISLVSSCSSYIVRYLDSDHDNLYVSCFSTYPCLCVVVLF